MKSTSSAKISDSSFAAYAGNFPFLFLLRSKKEQMKMEVMKMYTCPMHPGITSDKPGKCSKCGMDMAKKN